MKYDELITFQPIEGIIQLRDAREDVSARKHVETYAISQEMVQRLSDVVIPQLQYDVPYDNSGQPWPGEGPV